MPDMDGLQFAKVVLEIQKSFKKFLKKDPKDLNRARKIRA